MIQCPNITCNEVRTVIKDGYYWRKSDSKQIHRYRCLNCKLRFSSARLCPTYKQKKRRLNPYVYQLLCSGVSQRRIARILRCNLKTVARKLVFLNGIYDFKSDINLSQISQMQFDEMESFEHTKLKPTSILVIVENKSRKILGIKVARMPAKGLIKQKSYIKYGKLKDERPQAFKEVFSELQKDLPSLIHIESDKSPRYPKWVNKYFLGSKYKRYKGRRGCVVGQGELKRGGKDPLFSLNHTCAMIRANVNRLFRRTWCTTKKIDRLQMHLNLYAHYHNTHLTK